MSKIKEKKPKKFFKSLLKVLIVLVIIAVVWTAFSLIGRVDAGTVIPDSASLRASIPDPVRLLDRVLSHEPLNELTTNEWAALLNMLNETPVLKNRLVRLAARGNFELALLSPPANASAAADDEISLAAAWDLGFFSPLLRILPFISRFVNIPNLYYVQAGKNSRFEYRMDNMTFYIGPYRNLLFITSNSDVYESRSAAQGGTEKAFSSIKPSDFDAALLLSPDFIYTLLADQDQNIAEILNNIYIDSSVEAGLSINPKKLEFRLAAPLSSNQPALSRFIDQRSQVQGMAEQLPAAAQYATILSAGTLDELYQAAVVFSGPELDDMLKQADSLSRNLLRLSLDELLFSWSGKEFAVFGMEGRPHPVYAAQIADERKRQEVFDRAFRSIVLSEDIRLNLDGMRIPRIEVPNFLQSLLQRWNIFLPSPYYLIYRDFILISESADTLLSALRAMQRNDVLPGTETWRNIAGGAAAGGIGHQSAFSLYYSLDLSVPFFLRKNTALTGFLSLYRQGLVRMGFDRGVVEISLSLIPGPGNGVTIVNGYPLDVGGIPSNQITGTGAGRNSRIFFTADNTAVAVDITDNTIYKFSGQGGASPSGTVWVIPADGTGGSNTVNAWVVSDRGRVTLVDGNMEPLRGFPVLTGLRLSAPPQAFNGRLYLCDEDGKVHTVDENGMQTTWETSFIAAVRSEPSFLTISQGSGRNTVTSSYAAVYPKSFFGEIWLLDTDGNVLPNWPAPVIFDESDEFANTGIAFGSPLLFAHNEQVHVAFICQTGELIVYDEYASPVSPFPVHLDGIFYLQPVFDGEYLWLVSADGTLFRVNLYGEILSQRIPNFSVMEEGYITVFDCDDDKIPEIFITGEGNALYAYTRNFRSLEGFPLPVWGKPYFAEAQRIGAQRGGRKAEIFGMGMDRRLYRWQFR